MTTFCGINNMPLTEMNLQNSLEIGSTQTDDDSKSKKLVSNNKLIVGMRTSELSKNSVAINIRSCFRCVLCRVLSRKCWEYTITY